MQELAARGVLPRSARIRLPVQESVRVYAAQLREQVAERRMGIRPPLAPRTTNGRAGRELARKIANQNAKVDELLPAAEMQGAAARLGTFWLRGSSAPREQPGISAISEFSKSRFASIPIAQSPDFGFRSAIGQVSGRFGDLPVSQTRNRPRYRGFS